MVLVMSTMAHGIDGLGLFPLEADLDRGVV